MVSLKCVALVCIIRAALALPGSVPQLDRVPPNAAHIAHDTDRDVFIVYTIDGNLLGEVPRTATLSKRQIDGTCSSSVSPSDLESLPGWSQITSYVTSSIAGGWNTVVTNDPNYPDAPVVACPIGGTQTVVFNGTPQCAVQTQSSQGSLVGASGTVTLSALQGSSYTNTITVTKTATFGVQDTFTTTFKIPDIVDISNAIQVSFQYMNSLATSTSTTTNQQTTETFALSAPANSQCVLNFSNQNCQAAGTVSQEIGIQGWVWFHYGKRINGHYYWAINMNAVVPDQSQLSDTISFQTTSAASTLSNYNGTCH